MRTFGPNLSCTTKNLLASERLALPRIEEAIRHRAQNYKDCKTMSKRFKKNKTAK